MTYTEGQMRIHELRALWYIASATNGNAVNQQRSHIVDGKEIAFKDSEKIHDAMETAKRHIQFMEECLDYMVESEKKRA